MNNVYYYYARSLGRPFYFHWKPGSYVFVMVDRGNAGAALAQLFDAKSRDALIAKSEGDVRKIGRRLVKSCAWVEDSSAYFI